MLGHTVKQLTADKIIELVSNCNEDADVVIIYNRYKNKQKIAKSEVVKLKMIKEEMITGIEDGEFKWGCDSEIHLPNGKVIIGHHDGIFGLSDE
jgi:hypothetical protein